MKLVKGFTLIEIMITITLCCILMGLASGAVRYLDRIIISAELTKLHAIMRMLAQQAYSTGVQQQLSFDLPNHRYTFQGTTEQFPPAVQFGSIPTIKGPPSKPTSLIQSPITFPDNRIIFYPTGAISSGTVYITNPQKNIVYALSCGIAEYPYIRLYVYHTQWRVMSWDS